MKKFRYAFLDSGVGGLPYLRFLMKRTGCSCCVYTADTKHFPYGDKSAADVTAFACGTVSKIIKHFDPQIIVVACNTITVTALETLRRKFDKPFVGTVPAIKPAVLQSKNKKIGIIATERTVNDIYIKRMTEEFGSGCEFFMYADSRLIKEIETGLLTAGEEEKKKAVAPALEFFRRKGTDTLVLGCTHFLNLREVFIKEAAPDILIADSLEGVIHQTLKICPAVKAPFSAGVDKGAFYVTEVKTEKDELRYRSYADKLGLDFGIF